MKDICSTDRMSWNLSNPWLRCCHNTLHASCVSHQINNFSSLANSVGVLCPQNDCISVMLLMKNYKGYCSTERQACSKGAWKSSQNKLSMIIYYLLSMIMLSAQWHKFISPCDSADPSEVLKSWLQQYHKDWVWPESRCSHLFDFYGIQFILLKLRAGFPLCTDWILNEI